MILRDTQWHLCSNGTLHTSKIHLKVVVRISLIRVWSSLSLGWSSDGFLPSVYWEEPTALQGQGMSSHWQSPGWWWELHIKFCLPCNSLDLYEWFIGSMYSSTPIIWIRPSTWLLSLHEITAPVSRSPDEAGCWPNCVLCTVLHLVSLVTERIVVFVFRRKHFCTANFFIY